MEFAAPSTRGDLIVVLEKRNIRRGESRFMRDVRPFNEGGRAGLPLLCNYVTYKYKSLAILTSTTGIT